MYVILLVADKGALQLNEQLAAQSGRMTKPYFPEQKEFGPPHVSRFSLAGFD